MNYMIGDREKVVSVETWETNAVVLDHYPDYVVVHTNHTLQKSATLSSSRVRSMWPLQSQVLTSGFGQRANLTLRECAVEDAHVVEHSLEVAA